MIKVRPLKWADSLDLSFSSVETSHGRYAVALSQVHAGKWRLSDDGRFSYWPTMEAAKAEAEARHREAALLDIEVDEDAGYEAGFLDGIKAAADAVVFTPTGGLFDVGIESYARSWKDDILALKPDGNV